MAKLSFSNVCLYGNQGRILSSKVLTHRKYVNVDVEIKI